MAWVHGMNPADAVFCLQVNWGGGGGGGGWGGGGAACRGPHRSDFLAAWKSKGIVRLLHLFNAKLFPGEALAGRRDHWRCGRWGKGVG